LATNVQINASGRDQGRMSGQRYPHPAGKRCMDALGLRSPPQFTLREQL